MLTGWQGRLAAQCTDEEYARFLATLQDDKNMSEKDNRGGPRPNSGRKVGYRKPDAKRNKVNVAMDDATLAKAKRLGNGNAGRGIRLALGCED